MPAGPVSDRMQERVARAEGTPPGRRPRLDLPTGVVVDATADAALPNAEIERMLARMSAEATQLSQRVAADVDSWRSGRDTSVNAVRVRPSGVSGPEPSGVRLKLRAASGSPPRTTSASPSRSEPRSPSPNGVRSLSP